MEKAARVLLWWALAFLIFQAGQFSGARHGGAPASGTHLNDVVACARQHKVLLDIGKESWTDPQRKAIEAMCDFPPPLSYRLDSMFPIFVIIGALSLSACLLCIAAKIRQSWRAGRIN